jgi:uncharacterized protein (TIGR03083 family)
MLTDAHDDPAVVDFAWHLRRETECLADVIEGQDPTTPVSSCPGWDLRRLAIHVGNVHRWATVAVATAAPPPARPADPADDVDLASWLREGVGHLLEAVDGVEPARAAWHPFPTDAVMAVWPRRMAHETAIHRVDAELALGVAAASPDAVLDPHLASDGIDEYFAVMLAGAAQRRGRQLPASTLHVHCTDVHGEWLVWAKGASVTVQREHAKGDVALRGPASALLLALWGRAWPAPGFEVLGDTAAGAEWLAVGGA